jgi:hypothetical protein
MFSLAQGQSTQAVWCQIVDLDTCYIGQLVGVSAEGVITMSAAAGAADTTGKVVPFGIVIATNNKTPVFDSTYNTESITDVAPSSNPYEHHVGIEGPQAKMARTDMVKVALIDPSTVIRGDIRNGGAGTAITVGTVTTDGANSCTTSTVGIPDPTYWAKTWATMYVRSGRAQGQYRVLDSVSSTSLSWDKATHVQVATSDTVVVANGMRPVGISRMQTDGEAMYIDQGVDCSSNYYSIIVHRLDLSVAGKEFVEFRFAGDHFAALRT